MSHAVFLSHSNVDKRFAEAICQRLEAAGVRCWMAPRDIRPGEDWAEAIINAMDRCQILVLVFSAHSNNSPQVRREIERAVNKGLDVLPFRIEDVPLSKSLEYFISAQHWLDAIGGELDVHLQELCNCVSTLLGRPVAGGTAAMPAAAALAPAAAPVPQPQGETLPPVVLEQLRLTLAQFIGPIAERVVRRAATPGRTAQEVVAVLALELDNEAERRQFLARCSAALR